MRRLIQFAVLILFVSQAHGAVTIGQFIDRIATTRDLSSLKLDRDKALTEGDMVKISVAIGIKVTTQTPDKVVTEKQVDTYLNAFNYELHGGQRPSDPPPGPPPNPPPGKGKGKGKGKCKHHSPSDPEDCEDDDQ